MLCFVILMLSMCHFKWEIRWWLRTEGRTMTCSAHPNGKNDVNSFGRNQIWLPWLNQDIITTARRLKKGSAFSSMFLRCCWRVPVTGHVYLSPGQPAGIPPWAYTAHEYRVSNSKEHRKLWWRVILFCSIRSTQSSIGQWSKLGSLG